MHDSDASDQPAPQPAPDPAAASSIPEETLKGAMTAFRKRLKLTILDHESRLGAHRPTSSGKKADVQGIIPPTQYGPEIWRELVRQGKLKSMGGGFYKLP